MRLTIRGVRAMKQRNERFTMITAYDYTAAQLADRAGIPLLLVGDSLGMVVQGHGSTLPVTLDHIIYHAAMVVRGSERALVVGDMPFLTYTTPEQAVANAGRLLREAGVQAVKLEGGSAVVPVVQRLVALGIPVMGHLGYTPQSFNQIGTRTQAREAAAARDLLRDALALQAAGAFAIVLELIPIELAAAVTERLHIPTIGIGAGAGCDGQVQVWHDLMGLYTDFAPRHARAYVDGAAQMTAALQQYAADVAAGTFPTAAHARSMQADELAAALAALDNDTA